MKTESGNKKSLEHLDLAITPQEARNRLDFQGYDEEKWDKIMRKGTSGLGSIGSHETKALIVIARGDKPQILGEVYRKLREEDGLPPNRPNPSTNV
jgi:hypothetical protein